jgi:hypothetical protein
LRRKPLSLIWILSQGKDALNASGCPLNWHQEQTRTAKVLIRFQVDRLEAFLAKGEKVFSHTPVFVLPLNTSTVLQTTPLFNIYRRYLYA